MLAFNRNIGREVEFRPKSPTVGIWALSDEISKRDMGLLKRNIGYGQIEGKVHGSSDHIGIYSDSDEGKSREFGLSNKGILEDI